MIRRPKWPNWVEEFDDVPWIGLSDGLRWCPACGHLVRPCACHGEPLTACSRCRGPLLTGIPG